MIYKKMNFKIRLFIVSPSQSCAAGKHLNLIIWYLGLKCFLSGTKLKIAARISFTFSSLFVFIFAVYFFL